MTDLTNHEKVAYLADLVTLIDYHESLGSKGNKYIVREFAAMNDKLLEDLKETHMTDEERKANEAGKSDQQHTQPEARTDLPRRGHRGR